MDYRMGIIANPRAGDGLTDFEPVRKKVDRNVELRGKVSYHISDSVTKLSEVVRTMINDRDVDVLAIYGGDGTLHKIVDICIYEFAEGRIKRMPVFALLGGGTQKAVFQWLGWQSVPASLAGKLAGVRFSWLFNRRGNPVDIFNRLVRTPKERLPLRSLHPLQIEFFNCEPGKDREEKHYGFFFIMGAVNRVIEIYDASGKSVLSGVKHTLLGVSAALSGLPTSHAKLIKRFNAEQVADDRPLTQQEPLSVVCSITESLLFGFKPFMGKAESNQFYVASYSVPSWFLVALLPTLARALWVPKGDRFHNQPAMVFEMIPDKEETFFVDGDFYRNKPGERIRISLGPSIELIPYF